MTHGPDPAVDHDVVDAPMRRVVVLAGGDPVTAPLARVLAPGARVIAADSGLAVARALDLDVDLVVGDLDSVDPAHLAEAEAAGVPVQRHPVAKDRTDLAIALDAAASDGPAQVTVVGGHGGRLDHLVANALLLAAPAYAQLDLVALMGPAVVTVIRGASEVTGQPGELVSLLPVHGDVLGVTTGGLRFPLDDEDLPAGSSRGVSNVFAEGTATVTCRSGVLVAIQPGPAAL